MEGLDRQVLDARLVREAILCGRAGKCSRLAWLEGGMPDGSALLTASREVFFSHLLRFKWIPDGLDKVPAGAGFGGPNATLPGVPFELFVYVHKWTRGGVFLYKLFIQKILRRC